MAVCPSQPDLFLLYARLLAMGLLDWIKPRRDAPETFPDVDFVRGDRDTLERIYRQTFEQVRRSAAGVLREPADRDAIVQQVYLDLIAERSLRESYRGGSMGAWLAAIARHRALDFARRERRLAPLEMLHERSAEAEPADEFREDLKRFASRLDPERKKLLTLRFFEGMTQVEAARALSMPRSTLESREHELKALMRAHFLGHSEQGGER
jgi:RNA polymerase sigma-70 factor (ECF subfamily)